MPTPDPWSAFLAWLTSVMVPDWEALISMLPFFLVLGVVGPILTLIVLMWAWYLWHRRRGHVSRSEVDVRTAPSGPDGRPVFPSNVPFCEEHALLYPPNRTTCEIDRAGLTVTCPMDGTARDATVQVCSACGTRYVLGVGVTPLTVRSAGRPPEGGAAAA